MSLSLYEVAVPPVLKILAAQQAILDKATAYCAARKIDPAVMLAYRLAPDMFAFTRQLQIMTDHAKGLAARLAEVPVPSYADTESSFDDLKARLAKTADFVGSLAPERFAGAENRSVVLKIAGTEVTFTGLEYAVHFALPNFYFHATTAYDILRLCGVDVGKRDFLGAR
jgi:hypothetical protein